MNDTLTDGETPMHGVDPLARAVICALREYAHMVRERGLPRNPTAAFGMVVQQLGVELAREQAIAVHRAAEAFVQQPDMDLTAVRASCWVNYDEVDLHALAHRLVRLRRSTTGVLGGATIG